MIFNRFELLLANSDDLADVSKRFHLFDVMSSALNRISSENKVAHNFENLLFPTITDDMNLLL